jgi:hypothetical protein
VKFLAVSLSPSVSVRPPPLSPLNPASHHHLLATFFLLSSFSLPQEIEDAVNWFEDRSLQLSGHGVGFSNRRKASLFLEERLVLSYRLK